VGNRFLVQSAEMGALPTLYAATQDLPGASFLGPGGFQEQRGYPVLARRTKRACDAETARRLWELSERLTGTAFPLGAASHTEWRELAYDACEFGPGPYARPPPIGEDVSTRNLPWSDTSRTA
jgi:hypothetical protein